MGFFDKLKKGLIKTKDNIGEKLNNTFANFRKVDEDFLNELEENLILSDVGARVSNDIISELRSTSKRKNIKEAEQIKEELKNILIKKLEVEESLDDKNEIEKETKIILVIGVNGAGKTTSIGKLANLFRLQGKRVLVVAADTFRAAAREQLEMWAKRANVDILIGNEKEDPASVVFKAMEKQENYDKIIIDTAGRLHNKVNLMKELEKIQDIVLKKSGYSTETLLVIDGTTGQNAISQAKEFGNVTNISGYVMTKLDGTSKGGVIFQIVENTKKPFKYIGVGEGIEDLNNFNSNDFVKAILE